MSATSGQTEGEVCERCGGDGYLGLLFKRVCDKCHGTGRKPKKKSK